MKLFTILALTAVAYASHEHALGHEQEAEAHDEHLVDHHDNLDHHEHHFEHAEHHVAHHVRLFAGVTQLIGLGPCSPYQTRSRSRPCT
jgi:hypothetical protein